MLSGLVVAHITCLGSSIVSQGSWSVSQWGMTRLYLVGTIPTKGWSAPLRAHSALINSSDEYRVRPEVFVRSSNIRAGNWKCSPPSSVDFVPVVCKVNATLNIKRKVQRFSSTARAAIAIQGRKDSQCPWQWYATKWPAVHLRTFVSTINWIIWMTWHPDEAYPNQQRRCLRV